MMGSLWAGVSGLQAHQVAMDVEGNNIANVNTVGFKYSRVNFSDMLSQTSKIATGPQGDLGGKNSMQIGLGTQVNSVTKIFKQGTTQSTDKNTDLALEGDGFFVVSPDGGKTYKYTRDGNFGFDGYGNFTDSNGYIVQGWPRDEETGVIDTTSPIESINIRPGLTSPASDTSFVSLKANLNSGDTVANKTPIYSLDQNSGWIDKNGDGFMTDDELH
nr:flagellar hook-basal body complex protein [Sulfurospirillum sp.]